LANPEAKWRLRLRRFLASEEDPIVRYDVFGRTDADAATVVLSAGLGGLGSFWRPQFEEFGSRFRIIVYDHRGTGLNAGELPNDYAIADMADDVVSILDHARVANCHFVGHALGGLVGLDLALREPSRVASLVLVNCWAIVAAHTRRCFAMRTALLTHVGVEAYVRAQPIFLYPAAWLSSHQERIERDEAHGIAHFQGEDTLMKRIAALLAFDVTTKLGGIKVPTLVAASRDDILVPHTCSQALVDGIPDSRLWLTPEGGHGCSVTEPVSFNKAVLDFLAEVNHR